MGINKVTYGNKVLLDVSGVTATESDVLTGKKIVNSDGDTKTGSMPNRGAVSQSLNTSTTSYTVPAGYHNGSGKVFITTQEKTVTSSTSAQTVTPDSGKVLSKVTISAMPTETKSATPSKTTQTITPSSGKLLSQVTVAAIPTNYIENGYKAISGEISSSDSVSSYSISASGITTLMGFVICADSGRSAFIKTMLNVSKLSLSTTGGSWTQTSWVQDGTSVSAKDATVSFANSTLTITAPSDFTIRGTYEYIIIGR